MRKIAVVGLGYVGLPVAVEFGKKQHVIGFDISEERIKELNGGNDFTNEVSDEDLAKADMTFTSDATMLKDADFIIVAVTTPITENKLQYLSPVLKDSDKVVIIIRNITILLYLRTLYN